MSSAFETTTETKPLPIASRKRAWIWALTLCGSAVAVTAYIHPHIPAMSSDGFEAAKPVQAAATAQHKFTLLAGGTIAIIPDDAEDSGWRVLLVPTHGQTETIYYGDSEQATRIYTLVDEVQRKANDTGRAQAFIILDNGVVINEPLKN